MLVRLRLAQNVGHAEVDDLGVASLTDNDVRWLDVGVDNQMLVGVLGCLADTQQQVDDRTRFEVVPGCVDVDRFAPRLSFYFNAHNDFFEEIAKYRAARRLWARIMRLVHRLLAS